MKLLKRKNGFYYIYYRRGYLKSLKTKDKIEATRIFNLEKEEIRAGKIIELEKISRIPLSEFIKEYKEGSNLLPMRSLSVSPDTLDNDDLAFKKFIDICGDLHLRQVKRKQIDDFKSMCLQLGHKETYINILLRSLRAAFNTALSAGYISENPFIKKKGLPSILFHLDDILPRFLSLNEISSFFKVITDKDFLFAVQMYLYTGLRRAELIRLQYQDIDLENGFITVRKTKSKKDRTVPVPEEFQQTLRDRIKSDIGPLFPRWRSPDTMSRLFNTYIKKAGIKARLHDLRHSFGTHLRMAGVQLDVIQKLMGHTDIKTTQIYAKIVDETLKQEANKLRFNIGI